MLLLDKINSKEPIELNGVVDLDCPDHDKRELNRHGCRAFEITSASSSLRRTILSSSMPG